MVRILLSACALTAMTSLAVAAEPAKKPIRLTEEHMDAVTAGGLVSVETPGANFVIRGLPSPVTTETCVPSCIPEAGSAHIQTPGTLTISSNPAPNQAGHFTSVRPRSP